MKFSDVTQIILPEGEVKQISVSGEVIWSKPASDYRDIYQRIESITASGHTAYFATDYIADNTTGLEITASVPAYADNIMGGSRISGTNSRYFPPYPYSASRLYAGWNTSRSMSASTAINTKYMCRLNWLNCRAAQIMSAAGTLLTNGSVSFGTTALAEQASPIYFFCASNGSGTSHSYIRDMTLYGARISQDGEIVREYVPCRRKEDGVIGLYELNTGEFLTNAGTGDFVAGADIEW